VPPKVVDGEGGGHRLQATGGSPPPSPTGYTKINVDAAVSKWSVVGLAATVTRDDGSVRVLGSVCCGVVKHNR
jgi:hypothetical protein